MDGGEVVLPVDGGGDGEVVLAVDGGGECGGGTEGGGSIKVTDANTHVAAVRVPAVQELVPETVYPESHVGWHVDPLARELVQLPTAPFVGAVDASQVAGEPSLLRQNDGVHTKQIRITFANGDEMDVPDPNGAGTPSRSLFNAFGAFGR